MNIKKCILIVRKLNNNFQYQWLDENYKLIPNIVPEKYLITDVDFSNLPSNIINNFKLFLGKEYFLIPIIEWLYDVKEFNIENSIFNLECEFGILLKNLTLNK